MNYEYAFYILLAFLLGRLLPSSFYIGYDKEEYEKAEFGILLRK